VIPVAILREFQPQVDTAGHGLPQRNAGNAKHSFSASDGEKVAKPDEVNRWLTLMNAD